MPQGLGRAGLLQQWWRMPVADVYWVYRRIWKASWLFFLQIVLRNMLLYFLILAFFSPSFSSPSMMSLGLLFTFFFLSRDLSLKQCSKLYYQAVKPRVIHYFLVSSFHSLWDKGQFCKSAVAQGPPMRTTACSMWVWEPGKAARSGLCNGFPAHMLVTVCIDISCKAQN